MNTDSAPNVVVLETDLFFAAHIESVVQAAGAVPVFIGNGDALWQAIDRWPELVVINLAMAGWKEPVRRAKNLPHTRHIPIIGYGSHVEVQALQAARAAGCDHVWERSRFISELPDYSSARPSPAQALG